MKFKIPKIRISKKHGEGEPEIKMVSAKEAEKMAKAKKNK